MTTSEAEAIMSKLLGAFPAARREQATIAIYVEQLEKCKFAPGLEAVNKAIVAHKDSRSLPTIGAVLDEYRTTKARDTPPALPLPELTEAEREENLRRVRELVKRYTLRSP